MKQKTSFYNRIKALFLAVVSNRTCWVFRRYRQVESFSNAEGALIEESFALHFVEPFKSKKEAQKAIDNAKLMQPWQEYVILYGC